MTLTVALGTDVVDSDEIAADAVDSSEIAADAVGNSEMADNAVGSAEIVDASVANADLANSSLTIGTTEIDLGATEASLAGLTEVQSAGVLVNPNTANESLEANVAFAVQNDNGGIAFKVNSQTSTTVVTNLEIYGETQWNNNLTVAGNVSSTGSVSAANAPTASNHLTRKDYVDAQIAANISGPAAFDYKATTSTIINSNSVTSYSYYLNGANVFYACKDVADNLNVNNGYTFTIYGSGLDDVATAQLYLRGSSADLTTSDYGWSASDESATFTLTYSLLTTLADGQTDGVVRCPLILDGRNSGITMEFFMDSNSAAPASGSFN